MAAPVIASFTALVEHTTAVASITIGAPPSVAAGELMLAHIDITDDRNVNSVPSGWTVIQNAYFASVRTISYWKRYAGGDPADWTWGFNAGGGECGGTILRITGALASGDPVDDSSEQSGSSDNVTWPALTTTVDECLIVRLLARGDNYVTIPATELYNQNTSSAQSPGQWACHHFEQPTAGAVASQSAGSSPARQWATNSIAIAPALAVAGGVAHRFFKTGRPGIIKP